MSEPPNFHNFFDDRKSKSIIFHNYFFLTPEYHPRNLIGREKLVDRIWSELEYALNNDIVPKNYFLYGLPGTGKTATMDLILQRISQWAHINNKPKPIICSNNCAFYNTPYRILREICNQLNVRIPPTGLSMVSAYNRFLNAITRTKESNIILILDELDLLMQKKRSANEFLYKLIRAPLSHELFQLSLFGITNDLSLKNSFDSRIKSSLNPIEIYFPPYSAIELQGILHQRAVQAFKKDVLENGVIELIAAHFTQHDGDCRKAIAVLRTAGEIADKTGVLKVRENHVRTALKKYLEVSRQEIIDSLSSQSRIILESIQNLRNEKDSITGNIYREYSRICQRFNCRKLSQRQFNNHIKKLEKLNLINTERTFRGRGGNTRKITFYFS